MHRGDTERGFCLTARECHIMSSLIDCIRRYRITVGTLLGILGRRIRISPKTSRTSLSTASRSTKQVERALMSRTVLNGGCNSPYGVYQLPFRGMSDKAFIIAWIQLRPDKLRVTYMSEVVHDVMVTMHSCCITKSYEGCEIVLYVGPNGDGSGRIVRLSVLASAIENTARLDEDETRAFLIPESAKLCDEPLPGVYVSWYQDPTTFPV